MTSPSLTAPTIRPIPTRETELEPLVWVVLHNDDVTPMDFVIHILLTVFQVDGPNALHLMFTAHYNGTAYVQRLPRAEAQNRVNRAHFAAAAAGWPLRFTIERDE